MEVRATRRWVRWRNELLTWLARQRRVAHGADIIVALGAKRMLGRWRAYLRARAHGRELRRAAREGWNELRVRPAFLRLAENAEFELQVRAR